MLLPFGGEAALLGLGRLELLLDVLVGPLLALEVLLGQELPFLPVPYDLALFPLFVDVPQKGDGPASSAGLAYVAAEGICEDLLEGAVGVLWVLLPDLLASLIINELVGLIRIEAFEDGPEPDLLRNIWPLQGSGLVMREVVLELGVSLADRLVEVLDGALGQVLVLDRVSILVEQELGGHSELTFFLPLMMSCMK